MPMVVWKDTPDIRSASSSQNTHFTIKNKDSRALGANIETEIGFRGKDEGILQEMGAMVIEVHAEVQFVSFFFYP